MQVRSMLKRGLQFFTCKAFRFFSAENFSMLAGLIALLGITITITLCCMKASSKFHQIFSLVFFFLKIFSSCIFHTQKFRFFAGAGCKIFAISQFCDITKRIIWQSF